ncbi:hypothetical protein Tdes44962_MAKER05572 [Teratosphaeria destructans]|uniref:Uncharacterized protein n=1 Tax=Teratosphaeria destructans TaxID=418781 RepID=A0A9W7VYQ7_9PEZI|nr:hypothetical protein Tdes44962_MAKER05572 [Teratosphaeria destructans]
MGKKHPVAEQVSLKKTTSTLALLIILTGKTTCFAPMPKPCWTPNATINTPATTQSAIIEPEFHAYTRPPKFMAKSKAELAPESSIKPTKSNP